MAAAQKAFNPIEYKNEFTVLAQRAPEEAADVALKWRERFMNQARGMQETTSALLEIGIAGGVAAAAGWMDGGYEAERAKAVEDWQDGGAEDKGTNTEDHPEPWDHAEGGSDPTKLFGVVDKVLAGTLVIAALAIFNVAGTYTPLVRSGALGGFAYWLGNMTRSMAFTRKETDLKKVDADDAEEDAATT